MNLLSELPQVQFDKESWSEWPSHVIVVSLSPGLANAV